VRGGASEVRRVRMGGGEGEGGEGQSDSDQTRGGSSVGSRAQGRALGRPFFSLDVCGTFFVDTVSGAR
jgi:hypothetical protein